VTTHTLLCGSLHPTAAKTDMAQRISLMYFYHIVMCFGYYGVYSAC